MKLRSVEIENFRAIKQLKLSLDESLTVFHGDNAHGKTSVLAAIAAALGAIPTLLPEVTGTKFRDADRRRSARSVRVVLETTDGIEWAHAKRWYSQHPIAGGRYAPKSRISLKRTKRAAMSICRSLPSTTPTVLCSMLPNDAHPRSSRATLLWRERSPFGPTSETSSSGSTPRKTKNYARRDVRAVSYRGSWRRFARQSRR